MKLFTELPYSCLLVLWASRYWTSLRAHCVSQSRGWIYLLHHNFLQLPSGSSVMPHRCDMMAIFTSRRRRRRRRTSLL